ncbi:MAG: SPOR domain-containing protein [Bacteroidetes bacterium]|nr:SPOR domain-containing protein [Bacteroidota bacterium]
MRLRLHLQKLLILLLFVRLHPANLSAQEVCLSDDENRLATLINQLRQQHRLPEIALSASLTFVAKTHVNDLQLNRPDTSICSTASWSNKGQWTPCCFTALAPRFECMWNKPRELTNYTFRGYEISHFEEGIIHVDSLFSIWMRTPAVVDMLLGRNAHSDKRWAVMGIAIGENYASLWLGQRPDAAGKPALCRNINPANEPSADKQMDVNTKPGKYHLIFASFSNRADANEAVRRFRNSGFPNAAVIAKDGRFRVSINTYKFLKEAMEAREKLLAEYPDIWVMKE